MKLISMADFVLRQSKIRENDNFNVETEDYFNRCESYAEFLKQPLKLGMFIPCDLDNNELKDPGLIPSYELKQYREAKERVLFKGWELKINELYKDHMSIHLESFKFLTIESMVYAKPELTQTVIKNFLL